MFGVVAAEFARIAGRIRPRLRLRPQSNTVKINIGSGVWPASGWINVEGGVHALMRRSPRMLLGLLHRSSNSMRSALTRDEYVHALRDHEYVFYNLDRGLPFDDGVADYVYSSHVLEHFYKFDAEHLIREMFRVLRPGGVVRVCVPDLEHALRLYQDGRKAEALGYFFPPERRGAFTQHHYMYDFEMLSALLAQTGFTEITRRSYREGDTPDLDKLDNRPEETLYVEAKKPGGSGAQS